MHVKSFVENNNRTRTKYLKNHVDHDNATAKQSSFNFTYLLPTLPLKVLSKTMNLEHIMLHISQLLIQPKTFFC